MVLCVLACWRGAIPSCALSGHPRIAASTQAALQGRVLSGCLCRVHYFAIFRVRKREGNSSGLQSVSSPALAGAGLAESGEGRCSSLFLTTVIVHTPRAPGLQMPSSPSSRLTAGAALLQWDGDLEKALCVLVHCAHVQCVVPSVVVVVVIVGFRRKHPLNTLQPKACSFNLPAP